MKKKWFFFLIGLMLCLFSLPLSTKMMMELIHNQNMDTRYQITDVNEEFDAAKSTYRFHNNTIEIKEVIQNDESYVDPWDYKIALADLFLVINGEEIDTLQNYPVRVEEGGLNRYYGEIAYLTVEDKKLDKTQFIILLKKTREIIKETPDGSINGFVPQAELQYTMYTLEDGKGIVSESFHLPERNGLQTKLLNTGMVVPSSIGYYTDAFYVFPSLFFPIIFPFCTLITGVIFLIIFFPFKKFKNSKTKKA
ncbi:hypothetical protein [Bacillus manliponensis]|uniref:hypothetical protein n=1 Tax=Bacillus manliponensis TaxID=574376 RepID=UPI0035198418